MTRSARRSFAGWLRHLTAAFQPGRHRGESLGDRGERLAAQYLRVHGYRIVDRNWRGCTGEIDLIVRKGRSIVFVEVKTRQVTGEGDLARDSARESAFGAVHRSKQRQIARGAIEWWARHGRDGWSLRFDVVAVLVDGDDVAIEHLEHAFESPI